MSDKIRLVSFGDPDQMDYGFRELANWPCDTKSKKFVNDILNNFQKLFDSSVDSFIDSYNDQEPFIFFGRLVTPSQDIDEDQALERDVLSFYREYPDEFTVCINKTIALDAWKKYDATDIGFGGGNYRILFPKTIGDQLIALLKEGSGSKTNTFWDDECTEEF